MKLLICPLAEDGECISLPSPVFIRLNEDVLEGGWTLTLANLIKTAISRKITSASDEHYPTWVQSLHAINAKRVLLVNTNDQSQQYLFQEQPPQTTLVEPKVTTDNTLPGMIDRRAQVLQTLQDLDEILLARLQSAN